MLKAQCTYVIRRYDFDEAKSIGIILNVDDISTIHILSNLWSAADWVTTYTSLERIDLNDFARGSVSGLRRGQVAIEKISYNNDFDLFCSDIFGPPHIMEKTILSLVHGNVE